MRVELEFCDEPKRLVLPVGCRVDVFDPLRQGSGFSRGDISAAESCAARNNVDLSGQRSARKLTFISAIHGYLRVINRMQTTDTKPSIEREPFFRTAPTYDRVCRTSGSELSPQQNGSREVGGEIVQCETGSVGPRDAAGISGATSDEAERDRTRTVSSGDTDAVEAERPDRSVSDAAELDEPDEVSLPRQSGSGGPLKHCGIVAVVDFMNLFMRAWHAGEPSNIHAVRSMLDTIGNVIDRLSPEFLVFAMDGGSAYRRKLYPAYKAGRETKPPELLKQIALAERAIQAIGWPSIRVLDWEADDVLASIATQFDEVSIGVVLVTSDKDCLQVCASTRASVYHPWGEGVYFGKQRCLEKFGVPFSQIRDYLSLCGDSTDNIPGVQGVGPKTAAELLTTHGSLDAVLKAAKNDQVKGKTGERLRDQAAQAKLSRDLVTLRCDLPVGDHWTEWPLSEPNRGWPDHLKDLGLFASAQRLKDRLPAGVDHRDQRSHIDMEWAAVESIGTEAIQLVPVTITDPDTLLSSDSKPSPERKVYHQAFAHFQAGRKVASGYHAGTLLRLAWDTGMAGQPFETIDVTQFDHFGRPKERKPEPAGALF